MGVKVRASLCLSSAITCECGFSVSQSCFFSGLQFPRLCTVAKHHLTLPFSHGAPGAPLAVFLSPCFLSVLSPLSCHLLSHLRASQQQREGYLLPVIWYRGRVQPADYRCGGLQVGGEVSPGTWSALLSPDRQTVPATFLHCLQPLLQDPSQVCGAREVSGAQRQSQGGNPSSFGGTWAQRGTEP